MTWLSQSTHISKRFNHLLALFNLVGDVKTPTLFSTIQRNKFLFRINNKILSCKFNVLHLFMVWIRSTFMILFFLYFESSGNLGRYYLTFYLNVHWKIRFFNGQNPMHGEKYKTQNWIYDALSCKTLPLQNVRVFRKCKKLFISYLTRPFILRS